MSVKIFEYHRKSINYDARNNGVQDSRIVFKQPDKVIVRYKGLLTCRANCICVLPVINKCKSIFVLIFRQNYALLYQAEFCVCVISFDICNFYFKVHS